MPQRLKKRQEKIQHKRRKTLRREFVMEICSWMPIVFYRNQGLISKYPKSMRCPNIVKTQKFNGDGLYQIDCCSGNFFSSFTDLFEQVDLPATGNFFGSENSLYSDTVLASKNIYLSNTVIRDCENVFYSISVKSGSYNIYNSIMIWGNVENVYFSTGVMGGYNIFYSVYSEDCSNIWFCSNLIGCHECIFCNNLENKSYCIYDKQYDKDVYFQKKIEFLQQKKKFFLWHKKAINDVSHQEFLWECENVTHAKFVGYIQNGNNLFLTGAPDGDTNMYDCCTGGGPYAHHAYGVMATGATEHTYLCVNVDSGVNNYYSFLLVSCSYCLGCIGLKNKSFCIFNKQYTKEERFDKVDEIFTQMEKEGTLGSFFPGSMNPFYFNDTAAYLIDDSFTKEEVEAEGYMWRDEEIKVDIPEGMEVVDVKDLGEYEGWKQTPTPKGTPSPYQGTPNAQSPLIRGGADEGGGGIGKQRWIDPEILKKVIRDENGNVYRIVKMEYDFLMKHELPLPRLHWLDRLKMNFKIK